VRLERYWEDLNPVALALWPWSWLFCLVASARRAAYRSGVLLRRRLPVPVVVVGNLTVGGTGKTPLVVWLSRRLAERGLRPGILTRGYGGGARDWPRRVRADSDPRLVGDEPVLLARRCPGPVVAGPDRVAGGLALLAEEGCDWLVADDGLQHYALARDLEIAVVDGRRRFGNGLCLPAGPLRERPGRLRSVDLVVVNGGGGRGELGMRLVPGRAVHLRGELPPRELAAFRGQALVAVAGIGAPARFFGMLRGQGLAPRERPFPDHHRFRPEDLAADEGAAVLMTEKDAVKCEPFAGRHCWYVPVEAEPDEAFARRFDRLVTGLSEHGQEAT
jgi:tetraacyldisaccharide 4'-kinase